MGYKENYEIWKTNTFFDEKDRKELAKLCDEKEIEDRFYKELEFGTGGLRGIMGVGSNRMNKYNIRKASCGFADYLADKYGKDIKRGVAIAYDTRHNSKDFAKEAALSFASKGVPVYLYNMYSATPLLSYTVRKLGCIGGVVCTASHNPKEYNGYKAYNEKGCQLGPDEADAVIACVNATDVTKTTTISEDEAVKKGLLKYLGEEMLEGYSKAVREVIPVCDYEENSKLKVAYSPMHGCGKITVERVLKDSGFTNLHVVKEQEEADGDFPTVASPNPGNEPTMAMVRDLAEKIDADIAVASDPDADRSAVCIRHNGKLEFLDGNKIGALLFYFMVDASKDKMPKGPFLVTTIVTGELACDIARANNIKVYKTLTGFKYICGLAGKYDDNEDENFFFGYEESFGYVSGSYAMDKCSAFAITALCTACAYYKKQGKTLGDVMDEIHEKYGYYDDELGNYRFTGKEGADIIKNLMSKLRSLGKDLMPGIVEIKDYSQGIDGLPKENVLKFFFDDGSWMAVRPSGTEPLLKSYYSTKGKTKEDAEKKFKERKAVLDGIANSK